MRKIIAALVLGVLLVTGTHAVHASEPPKEKMVTVFFNEACQDCGELVKEIYPMLFGEYGYQLELLDYINERENRKTLTEYNDAWGIPFELQSHIEAFVGDNLLIGGHVPRKSFVISWNTKMVFEVTRFSGSDARGRNRI